MARHEHVQGQPQASLDDYQKLSDVVSLVAQHLPSLKGLAEKTQTEYKSRNEAEVFQAARSNLARVMVDPADMRLVYVNAAMGAWQQAQEQGLPDPMPEAWVKELEAAKLSLAATLAHQMEEAEQVESEMCHAIAEFVMAISQVVRS